MRKDSQFNHQLQIPEKTTSVASEKFGLNYQLFVQEGIEIE